MFCYQLRSTRNAAGKITHTNPDACKKTDENDTACLVTTKCSAIYESCPLIQSTIGVIMCFIENNQIEPPSTTICNRMCHSKAIGKDGSIEIERCNKPKEDESLSDFNSTTHPGLDFYELYLEDIDLYKKYVGSGNLPKDLSCKALNVPESICRTFTKYRVLLCGSNVWQQVQCYEGNCNTDRWPIATTNGCQYAVASEGIALCPSDSNLSCRFICSKKNDTCSKKKIRYRNTASERKLMLLNFNFTEKDWKSLTAL